ncbi:hypothetical protein V5N11_029444 [Cardamine amara subsp. amara]|uniref:Uncharacterized protein n=1 Tax=Cardamine amara subsp. amara TaxID=228776 RepID=A0ABD1C177_CARAN
MQYIKEGVVPPNKWDARKLKQLSSKYCIIDLKLYKRSISGPYLVCVHGLDMLKVMAELHEGSCGSHSGGRASAIRIKKQGYFGQQSSQIVKPTQPNVISAKDTHL